MTRDRALNLPPSDWRSRDKDFQEPKLSENLQLVEVLKRIAAAHGRTAGEVALAWTLANPAVTAAIVGLRNAGQVEGVKGALEFRLDAEEVRQIEDFQRSGAQSAARGSS